MDNQISAVMTATMSKFKEMVDTNTVVGEPITTPDDITLIPLSRVSFAFASGGSEFPMKENKNGVGCGSGAGVKVEPMGFLIVKDGNVRSTKRQTAARSTLFRPRRSLTALTGLSTSARPTKHNPRPERP